MRTRTVPPPHGDATSVEVFVPSPLRQYCDGARKLMLSAATVRATLEELERSYPPLYRSVCDETGAVRQHINVFVNSTHMRDREGLDTALASGDTIIILPAVSGG
jgi:molybdopterin converting factor small subunit